MLNNCALSFFEREKVVFNEGYKQYLLGFWGFMMFVMSPIPRRRSSRNQQPLDLFRKKQLDLSSLESVLQ